ncbi:Uncharacterised protein [Leminorella richardii]|uniref:Uncharacterized protein n=1 Tax=Leminorella richardii TaxID=158841 RepID=A0A2X4US96_9GAMM|nr:hypothetical protein [Leminorella richardii]SQI42746.1 Uncharacterised protein [Leminorella richardii]
MKRIITSIAFSGLLLAGVVNAAEERESGETWADTAFELLATVNNLAEVATTVTTKGPAEN